MLYRGSPASSRSSPCSCRAVVVSAGGFIPRSREEPGLSLGNKHPLRAPSQEAGPHYSLPYEGLADKEGQETCLALLL